MNKQHRMTKKFLIPTLVITTLFLIGIQFIQPELTNPPVTADFQAPENVKSIIKRACYDCHSNETDLRWYDKVSPVSWQVAKHVNDGRSGLNFSHWDSIPPAAQKAKLWEAVNQIVAGAMPIKSYQLVHTSAKVSASDLVVLKNYLSSMVNTGPTDSSKINAANTQFKNWKNEKVNNENLPTAANGISYIPDYKNWKPISSSGRFDNGTMRIIYGNDIAVKAIAEKHINPWPNGTILAKVAWDQIEDREGNVRTGAFKQVEYMIKDDQKFESTKGWGFARFKTSQLVPYGATAVFAQECVACHIPMADNDFVFTQPLKH